MEARSIVSRAAPALLVLCAGLVLANWYLQPARAGAWASALLIVAGMTLALLLVARRDTDDDTRRRTREAIERSVVWAGLIVMVALSQALVTRLAISLGAPEHVALSGRPTMVLVGAYFVITGNALPKTLTPLSAMRCNPAVVQAFHRFAGWTWVLTGFALALAWIALPLGAASTATLVLIISSLLLIAAQAVRLRVGREP